jgi:hypothetical protein
MAGQNTSSENPRRFDKELNEDVNDFHLSQDSWTQARNAINNSKTGDLGKVGNEPSNLFCTKAPYPIIGAIHLEADEWTIFSTDDVNSEIGTFKEDSCEYKTLVNDPCLAFDRAFLIKGVSRATSDCSFKVYWDDGKNPSRVLDINDIPWKQICTDENDVILPGPPNYDPVGCIICEDTTALNCEELRLARRYSTPCFRIERGTGGGTLPNGSYFAVIAYTVEGQVVTDYSMPSNLQPIFDHSNVAGSIDILIDSLDTDFDEFELVLVSIINQQTVSRRVGLYSTRQSRITLDIIDPRWTVVPLEKIPLRTPVYEKTDAMFTVNDYLIRTGPTTKFNFNYQPLANQIIAKWQAVEYPQNYYQDGGSNTGYYRDEVYCFFIRWIYDTGDKTDSYHIPGRPAFIGAGEKNLVVPDALPEEITDGINFKWAVQNTAVIDPITPYPNTVLPDGGVVVGQGYMGYWESSEKYPDTKPEIWNANYINHPWTSPNLAPYPNTNVGYVDTVTNTVVTGDYDLCGDNIRHHKFPDNTIFLPSGGTNTITSHFTGSSPNFGGQPAIRVMGVKFENVRHPVDNQGNLIPGIVGYEILRGSRQGNRTIIAKGVVSNMGLYDLNVDEDDNSNTFSGPRKGAYVNYPYNDLNIDPFLSGVETDSPFCLFSLTGAPETYTAIGNFSDTFYSFHSPDTTFDKPFLSGKEFKIHGELRGIANGKFEYSEKHPKFKVVSNLAFLTAALAGLGLASIAMHGTTKLKTTPPSFRQQLRGGIGAASASAADYLQPLMITPTTLGTAFNIGMNAASIGVDTAFGPSSAAALLEGMVGLTNFVKDSTLSVLYPTFSAYTGMYGYDITYETGDGAYKNMPGSLRLVQSLPSFMSYWSRGTDATLELIKALIKYKDYALKYNSHCFYNTFNAPPPAGSRRRKIVNQSYLGPNIFNFATNYKVNNLHRAKTVLFETNTALPFPTGDDTRKLATQVPALKEPDFLSGTSVLKDPTRLSFDTNSTCYYVGYKQRLRNQYGQLENIIQVPVSTCSTSVRKTIPANTDTLFNGDIYIARYTEKNTFFYFYEWLYDQPNGFEFDYSNYYMIPYPRFWLNSIKWELQDSIAGFTNIIQNTLQGSFNANQLNDFLPSSLFNLDGYNCGGFNLSFSIRYAYYYLFNSGVKDFFVESEINVGLRNWGDFDSEKHYPILDTKELFDTQIIKSGNYYRYDASLGISRTYLNYAPWGNVQSRYYDPSLAETCYQYTPTRAIYSLPAQFEGLRDNWYIFLANNYYDFNTRPVSIKPINKNGALIFFESESPTQFLGVDQLQTDAGTKLTIGDGGLFSQPMQNILNADRPYEYGSCQDRLSVINTPMGVYWMSQNQGKIFSMQGGPKEISMQDMKWWLASYLPYKLTEQFPDFELRDNPVIGIGCQSIYDNQNQLVYFSKRDFIVRKDLPQGTTVTYVDRDNFTVNGTLPVKLGDPAYFQDASWTLSYDPKMGSWISYHDWHPNLLLPGKNTFLSVKNDNTDPTKANGIWIHNFRCDSYCNYYGKDYPFEIEFMVNTAQNVNTLRSVEYIMEVYKYGDNCFDRFHVLDFNFDEAVIYNTEQCSGLLKLNLTPKNNAPNILNYPIINLNDIQILYSKEEQKYRFNQFWDITDSRGEFPIGSAYPPPTPNPGTFAQRMIWNTEANGYVRVLNPNNLSYSKNPLQRKKFRHYLNYVLLRRLVSGDRKMLVMIASTKNLYSPR